LIPKIFYLEVLICPRSEHIAIGRIVYRHYVIHASQPESCLLKHGRAGGAYLIGVQDCTKKSG
jgi:hypothetical protein